MAVFGYARVSTDGQTLDAQISTLKDQGCEKIFSEKVSGAKTDRKQLLKALSVLSSGDVLLVTALDRLGRSLRDILNVLDEISKRGVKFKSLKEPWADTTTDLGKFLTQVVGSVAELERSLILGRTEEGKRRARDRGVKFGRKPKLTDFQRQEAIRRLQAGEAQMDIARSYNISQPTISRLQASA